MAYKRTEGQPPAIHPPNKKGKGNVSCSWKKGNTAQNIKINFKAGRVIVCCFKLNTMKQKIALIIESSSEGDVWGRVHYDDNLIVESAADTEKLSRKMKKLLLDFHSL